MTTKVDLHITGRVESLHLEPGDRVLITLDQNGITPTQIRELHDRIQEAFPEHEAIILANGLRITRETSQPT